MSSEEDNLRAPERRRAKRSVVCLSGNVFCPQLAREYECTVKDISPGGAGIECDCDLMAGTGIVLYVNQLGRFEGQIVLRNETRVSIRFSHSERMQKKIAEKIILYLEGGLEDGARLRSAPRIQEPAMRTFTRRDGRVVDCDVADISLTGASIKTEIRPPIGEIIQIGRSTGRVVRHHGNGIAIEFLDRNIVESFAKKQA